MSQMNERGARSERSSALWGTGGRGGDRSSVLWGKGGRGLLVATMVLALAVPLAATAGTGSGSTTLTTSTDPAPDASDGKNKGTWIAPGLLKKAASNPNDPVDVIITATAGTSGADRAEKWLAKYDTGVQNEKFLDLVGGVSVTIPARLVTKLQSVLGVTVTPDATVKLSGTVTPAQLSTQLWPYASGNADMWTGDSLLYAGKFPAIAVIDSGVQQRSDFGSRIVASVNLSTLAGNTSLNDDRGHGTFVAGIAAGAAPDLTGAAPGAPIVSIKVMDANGQAKTSDVINACAWLLANKDKYNIRVANFSLHSSYGTNSYRDPLDQAVEKLWFNGVVVVTAAGNYGSATGPSGVLYSPGNDPFVITVGAIDLNGTTYSTDDTVAPWSAYGYTEDGFYKPEISAPGRYMVGPVPSLSTIAAQRPLSLVGLDRIQLSGTSFAAPVVAGTVAQMLARHPGWTPDQVKGALMRTARKISNVGNPKAAGLGELTATRAAGVVNPPNPNMGLEQFLGSVSGGTGQAFDAQSWASAAKSSMSWNSMSWTSQSWSDMSWTDQSWASMSWTDMSWNSMSWTDMSWTDMSWTDASQEDAVEGDKISGNGYGATQSQLSAAKNDPNQVNVDGLP